MKKRKLWVSTDCDWKNTIQGGEEVKRLIPIQASFLRKLQIANNPNQQFTWDKIDKMFEKEAGLSLRKTLMTRVGCTYGALNSASDVVDYYREGNWYGFKNGSREQERMVDYYVHRIKLTSEAQVIKELFAKIKKFVKNVPMKDITTNLNKQQGRNATAHTQTSTGKKAFNESIKGRTSSADYKKFLKNPR